MYDIIKGGNLVFVRPNGDFNAKDFSKLASELLHLLLAPESNTSLILIDLKNTYNIAVNFDNNVRELLSKCKLLRIEFLVLNAPKKTSENIRGQGMSGLISLKTCRPDKLEAVLGSSSNNSTDTEPKFNESSLSKTANSVLKSVFKTLGLEFNSKNSLSVKLNNTNEIASICQIESDSLGVCLKLEFIDKNFFKNFVETYSSSSDIDQDKLNYWSNEILNMVIAQFISSPENKHWNFKKIGQPQTMSESALNTETLKSVLDDQDKNTNSIAELAYSLKNKVPEEVAA